MIKLEKKLDSLYVDILESIEPGNIKIKRNTRNRLLFFFSNWVWVSTTIVDMKITIIGTVIPHENSIIPKNEILGDDIYFSWGFAALKTFLFIVWYRETESRLWNILASFMFQLFNYNFRKYLRKRLARPPTSIEGFSIS